jgi:hypothetical protein
VRELCAGVDHICKGKMSNKLFQGEKKIGCEGIDETNYRTLYTTGSMAEAGRGIGDNWGRFSSSLSCQTLKGRISGKQSVLAVIVTELG